MPVPAARTLEALKDSILRYLKLKDDTEADALAELALRSGIARLAGFPIKSMMAESEITLTTGTHKLGLPTDFSMAASLFLLDSNDRRDGRIYFKREEDFDFIVDDYEAESGTPEIYTVRGGSTLLELDRTPTSAVVGAHPKVRLRYFKRLDIPTLDTATFSIDPEVEEFLVWHGRSVLAPIYDAKMYNLAQQEANRALLDLQRRDAKREEMDWS